MAGYALALRAADGLQRRVERVRAWQRKRPIWADAAKIRKRFGTPRSYQSSQARLVNLCCILTAVTGESTSQQSEAITSGGS
jgi:hypothetical protein